MSSVRSAATGASTRSGCCGESRFNAQRMVDRLLGEHGIQRDNAPGRQQLQWRMEARRLDETDEEALKVFRRGWCLGSQEFREQLLEKMEVKLGDNHAGELRLRNGRSAGEPNSGPADAGLGWSESDLATRRKSDPAKLAIAARLRKETT